MNRADHVVNAFKKAIETEIAEGVKQHVDAGHVKIAGLTPEQIEALRKKFLLTTGLEPEKLTPEQISFVGELE